MWLVSDIHVHEFENLSSLKRGVNTRLLDGISILDQLTLLAVESEDRVVGIAGDLLYDRKSVSTMVQNLIVESLKRGFRMGVRYLVIPGNHDYAPGGSRYHSLHVIAKYATIIDKPLLYEGYGWIPYTNQRTTFLQACEQLESASALIVHQGFRGADVSSNWAYFIDEVAALHELPDVPIYAGHYHNPATLGKGLHTGSPIQLNWGDEGKSKFVYQLKDGRVVRRLSLKYPHFFTIAADSLADVKQFPFVEGNFVRVKASPDFPFHEAKRVLKKMGARAVDTPVVHISSLLSKKLLKGVESAGHISQSSAAWNKLIRQYARYVAKSRQMDYAKIVKVGRRLLCGS